MTISKVALAPCRQEVEVQRMILVNLLTLTRGCEIERHEKYSEILINSKWPPGVDPGGHRFVVLNVSINNTPVFVSAAVTFKN